MRQRAFLTIVMLLISLPMLDALPPRGGGKGGGGGGGKGGGHVKAPTPIPLGGGNKMINKGSVASRPSNIKPSFVPQAKPNLNNKLGQVNRPSGSPVARPSIGADGLIHPGGGSNFMANRPIPGVGGNLPNLGTGNKPNISGGAGRPNPGIANLPSIGIGGSNRPSIGADGLIRPGGSVSGSGNKINVDKGQNLANKGTINLGGKPNDKFNSNKVVYKPNIDITNKNVIKDNKIKDNAIKNDRPAIIGARPAWDNRPNININRPQITNVTNNVYNQTNINRTDININRDRYAYGGWANGYYHGYYHHLHNHWYHGGWNYWPQSSAGWFAAGTAFGWLTSPGQTIVYSNPYYVPTTNVVLNYSQPIQVPAPVEVQVPVEVPVEVPVPQQTREIPPPTPGSSTTAASTAVETSQPGEDSTKEEQAKQFFSEAEDAFKANEYPKAQTLVEKAIELLPGDATLHEFRALTLFAQHKYKDAAAAIYAVLAVGPGWDWDTLKSLYPIVETYTAQLRALEDYQKKNPNSGEASFLLAYEYLTLGEKESAIKQLENAVRITPSDQLSAQLLKMLKAPPEDSSDRPKPGM